MAPKRGMTLCLVACVLVVQAQGRYNFLESYKRASCAEGGTECFNSGQCCDAYVCTVPNGEPQADIPGMCVLEKDLSPCRMHLDCNKGQRCTSMGKAGSRFCVEGEQQGGKGKFGIGQECTSSADCNSAMGLCCKAVRRHIMGVKVMCDREQWTFEKCI